MCYPLSHDVLDNIFNVIEKYWMDVHEVKKIGWKELG